MGAKNTKYVWSIPQGYVSIKFTPFCLRVTYFNELVYFDRNLGQTVTEEKILQNMTKLDEPTQLALRQFFNRYPTHEDKLLFWCRGIQRTGRVLLKKYARELEKAIISQRLKKDYENNSTQKGCDARWVYSKYGCI
jgi:hypothetical protein